MKKKKLPIVLILSGLVVILTYLASAVGLITNANNIILTLVFAIGPVAIIGVLRIADRLSDETNASLVQTGKVFLIVGFSLFTLMLVVQQTIFLQFDHFRSNTRDQTAAMTLDSVFRGVNLVQLGMDVAFDIFYCIGILFFSAAMYRHSDFGRFIGIFGLVSAAGLLVLNLAAFPSVPAESGLIDLGPLTGVWWIVVVAQLLRAGMRDRKRLKENP